ncbi:hypothetical protein [Paracoccus sphaerophysae]|nr:hypothetical protein [Paracoccus sphaerophysae]
MKDALFEVEEALNDLDNLLCALAVVAEPFCTMSADRLSGDETDARNGLIGLRDALKWQCRKLGDAYEAAWRAAG